ncbi:basic membrane protein A [Tissierella praeacuta DSM 18095]|uniref:Basic membrane protein A n=1 Tax=Tissierella praeacuta DSM 18095 TaxID=1123404 RepID=A0A1M4V4D2_9FIRM|nr:BMP family protein [Tissierella praeacuta]TCU74067.1 basic membrane protein A [Tissierella praeacuta]SHE63748.1 basic membrane protein A [Tissierella praeacuta DSM 18095]SUP02881.1 Purine-binding protein BAB2_0673 precursor [Tissierella praeacuta]
MFIKKRSLALFLIFVLTVTLLGGCSSKENNETTTNSGEVTTPAGDSTSVDEKKDYKIVLLLPGPINDQGWNATAYEGLQLVEKDLGIKMEYIESVQQADFEAVFTDYGTKGYDLVFAHGTQFFDAAKKVGPQFPNTFYMVINSEEGQEPNVGGIGVREWEGGYIAGIIAAMNTESKQLGAIGSFPFPVIAGTLDAFEVAAHEIDPSIKVTKTFVNSWEDIQKGKETALAMAEAGADVIFCSANQVGLGSIEAAKSKGVKAVGYISPQNDIAPDTVISSVTYNTPGLFKNTVEQLVNGELKPVGASLGWADDVLDMQWGKDVKEELKDKVNETIEELKAGKIADPYKGE